MATQTATATVTIPERTINTILSDYELHHSQTQDAPHEALNNNRSPGSQSTRAWDTTHRNVPAYRPVNSDRDLSDVRVYLNNGERAFVTIMFTGLFINASAAKLWRGTFGKLNGNIFRYAVGGEY
ncbi:uncharacterized protein F5Z01DRAFT_748359 [Emericellopsis atlantica]|uniref:Uncharacterized protein n=1 Tax=Emericellopsis atlantica TaxID=2614577 RepID=A0A9P8CS26_9HYPO|nr:uncharacterized protein F5Z01DRAFT_748359 [Emericellopsis atlantica]KAG9256755.1 hypothetical protein F5Z01DRAFT_748359 [Emericellopsis atlantica]